MKSTNIKTGFLLILVIFLFALNILTVFSTRFFPIKVNPDLIISTVNINGKQYVAVKFLDHPPTTHSRFFDAQYDYVSHEIILREYQMIFHPFSKEINSAAIIILDRISDDSSWNICLNRSGRSIGTLARIGNNWEWRPHRKITEDL